MADPTAMPDAGADTSNGQTPEADDQPVLTYEIEVMGDGTYAVSQETPGQESNEGSEADESEAGEQTAQSLDEALAIVKQMEQARTGGSDKADQQAGFSGVFTKD